MPAPQHFQWAPAGFYWSGPRKFEHSWRVAGGGLLWQLKLPRAGSISAIFAWYPWTSTPLPNLPFSFRAGGNCDNEFLKTNSVLIWTLQFPLKNRRHRLVVPSTSSASRSLLNCSRSAASADRSASMFFINWAAARLNWRCEALISACACSPASSMRWSALSTLAVMESTTAVLVLLRRPSVWRISMSIKSSRSWKLACFSCIWSSRTIISVASRMQTASALAQARRKSSGLSWSFSLNEGSSKWKFKLPWLWVAPSRPRKLA